jgi:hypothetical protein
MKVYQVATAPASLATWLQQLLIPAAAAAGIEDPPPVEIRPCGRFSGLASGPATATDGRVSIDRTVLHRPRAALVAIFLHECTHRLLDGHAVAPHGPEFFTLQLVLLTRLDRAGFQAPLTPWAWRTDQYDLQDPPAPLADQDPAHWMPRVFAWGLAQAQELAPTLLPARALAEEICTRAAAWYSQLEAEPSQEKKRQKQIASWKSAAGMLPAVDRARQAWKAAAVGLGLLSLPTLLQALAWALR